MILVRDSAVELAAGKIGDAAKVVDLTSTRSMAHGSQKNTPGGLSAFDAAKMVASRTPPGAAVRVVGNPANPREAYVLDRRYPLFVLGFVMSAVLIAFHAMIVYAVVV